MSELPREPTAPEPSLPIPMRKPFSKRRRQGLLLVIVAALLVVIGVAIFAAVTTSPPPARPKVISADDRKAPLALRRAAAKVNFAPTTAEGVGTIESQPAEAARPATGTELLPVGSEAPPFTLKTPTGTTVSLSDFRGKAAAAGVLRRLVPALQRRGAAPADAGRDPAGGAVRDRLDRRLERERGDRLRLPRVPRPPVPGPARSRPASPPPTFPEHGPRGPVSRAYGVGYFPTFYVIDPKGKIAWASDGEQPDALLRQKLREAAGK